MKTKLYRLEDVQPILCKVDRSRIPSAEDLELKVKKQLTAGLTTCVPIAEGVPICHDDKVTLRITSVLPRFNRERIALTVGSGLYDKTVERELVGMCVGETANIIVRGEKAVFTVLNAERISYPELTDDMAHNQKIEGIHTVDAYKAYILDISQKYVVGDIVDEIVEQLIDSSEMSPIDSDDIEMSLEAFYESIRQHYLLIHFDVNELPADEWPKVFGAPNKEEFFRGMLAKGYEKIIPECLIYCALLGKPCEGSFDPTVNGQAEIPLRRELVEKYQKILVKEE